MNEYLNKSRRSGIINYEFIDDGVLVQFKNGSVYKYPLAGNDQRTMETMHGLLDHGEYANRLINARNPAFEKISGGEGKKVVDNRPYPENVGEKIRGKFLSRFSNFKDKFQNLKQSAMNAATSFKDWVKARF